MGDQNSGQKTLAREGALIPGASPPPQGVSMPRGLLRRQLMVFLMDVSGSMKDGKIDAANAAAIDLNQQLSKPENRNVFVTAYIAYAETARLLIEPTSSAQVNSSELMATVVNEKTNITEGLKKALEILERPPIEKANWLRPVVVLLTDGDHNEGPKPDAAAATLKAKADLITVGFGANANMILLRALATSPKHASHCKDGADLRRYFTLIGATVSRSIHSGQNATALLGGIAKG